MNDGWTPLRFFNLLPLGEACVSGSFTEVFLPPTLGGTVIFQNELNPSDVVNIIRREKISVLGHRAAVLQSLKQKMEHDVEDKRQTQRFRQDFDAAKQRHPRCAAGGPTSRYHRQSAGNSAAMVSSGGATLDAKTEKIWGRLGFAVIQGYGLTETTSLISLNHPFRLGKGSIGKVLPGREVKLADDGEILVKGAGVALVTGETAQPKAWPTTRAGTAPATSASSMLPAICISRDARRK